MNVVSSIPSGIIPRVFAEGSIWVGHLEPNCTADWEWHGAAFVQNCLSLVNQMMFEQITGSVCTGEAQSPEEAEQQKSERSVATLLTGTGPSWELHGPRVARRLRHRTRSACLLRPCLLHSIQLAHSWPICSICPRPATSASLWQAWQKPVLYLAKPVRKKRKVYAFRRS